MAQPHTVHHNSWTKSLGLACILVIFLLAETQIVNSTPINDSHSIETLELTACQHLRRAETRRAKSLGDKVRSIRIPRCNKLGDFEPIQCSNEVNNSDCWCVDEYGVEIADTRRENLSEVNCSDASVSKCLASSCRMFCPSGFSKDPESGCPVCRCRDLCDGIECPNGLQCEPQEVRCSNEPCPPIPTCRKARSLNDLCPAGQPLAIQGTARPFLCGTDPGKPSCPPLYRCLVQNGNDYGVCCPASLKFEKPGTCPKVDEVETRDETGVLCGTPCGHDLECPQMQKCCQLNGCGRNCVQPHNITTCHQARMLSELLSVNEREGRGYIPQCEGPGGSFSTRQCSRNGLVCWCVDPKSGNKVKGTMGAAKGVDCEGIEKVVAKASGRSVDGGLQCDYNICAAVCEYGFKVDHNGCPTCECSEPCEGFRCPSGSHCEVARDPKCLIDSGLCSSEPVCKPDFVYSNPCDFGTPLANNFTGELAFCNLEKPRGREYQRSFFDEDSSESRQRSLSNTINCPETHRCTKLHGESGSVCCPIPFTNTEDELQEERQQSMCEYLRDFSDRMEGTEEGMQLALEPPSCYDNGGYKAMQCTLKRKMVTKSEQRKIMEQNNIRQMRMLLENSQRTKRSTNLKLIKIEERTDGQTDFVRISERQMPLVQPEMIESRSARIIESRSPINSFDQIPMKTKKIDELIEMDVEECWCVDVFGTEIPKTRGAANVSLENCEALRQNLECLDITCRMGCDYGFILDPQSQCPSCECRDPCDGISCPDNQECRSVEVSCDGEYCPPVPACFPKKPGQCPFLVPPGSDDSDADACDYECRSDSHCEGAKRCCSNGCGTQCVEPQMKTACQHLQTIQLHQAAELGMPARQKYITQCNEDGSWKTVQCGPGNTCWCVDEFGNEKSGTRTTSGQPNCEVFAKTECPLMKCHPCEYGYKFEANGCKTCECRDPCGDISCPAGEKCDLVQVECISLPCPKMPICVPTRESVCPEGNPLKLNGREISCGPHSDTDMCPTTHMCQLNPITNRGTCCAKTRDVCFESIDPACLSFENENNNDLDTIIKWRFSPRSNKCVPVNLPKMSACLSKNLFHSETACKSVCPVLSQCERLRMKNNMAAKRAGQTNTWFQPRCDPETGYWSPVQCLGSNSVEEGLGVCWCADKKGAPMKGSLTKGIEPVCNSRQARRRLHPDEESSDPVMEELIRQITFLVDENNFMDEEAVETSSHKVEKYVSVTEKIIEIARSDDSNFIEFEQTKRLKASTTRCNALKLAASFPVACDSNGAFLSTQCNGDICWCVDAAGNQLPLSSTFKKGMRTCLYTPVDAVEVELHLNNPNKAPLVNVYDVLKIDLNGLIGNIFDNFRVHENSDLSVTLKFDLIQANKVDDAFAIEEMVRDKNFILYRGQLVADSTQSRFSHRIVNNLPIPQHSSGIPESTFQTIVFILATASAFLISIFVVFVMLKRGKNKMKTYNTNKTIGNGDKFLDYSSPIFVLSANDKDLQGDPGEDNSGRSNGPSQ